MVSHATCATGDGFSVNSTANQTAEYPIKIECCSIESSSGVADGMCNLDKKCCITGSSLFFKYPAQIEDCLRMDHVTCNSDQGCSIARSVNLTKQSKYPQIECTSNKVSQNIKQYHQVLINTTENHYSGTRFHAKTNPKNDKRRSVIKNTYKKNHKRQLSVSNVNTATHINPKKDKRHSVIKNMLQKYKKQKKPTKNKIKNIALS